MTVSVSIGSGRVIKVTSGVHLETNAFNQMGVEVLCDVKNPIFMLGKEISHLLDSVEILLYREYFFVPFFVLGDLVNILNNSSRVTGNCRTDLIVDLDCDGSPGGF